MTAPMTPEQYAALYATWATLPVAARRVATATALEGASEYLAADVTRATAARYHGDTPAATSRRRAALTERGAA